MVPSAPVHGTIEALVATSLKGCADNASSITQSETLLRNRAALSEPARFTRFAACFTRRGLVTSFIRERKADRRYVCDLIHSCLSTGLPLAMQSVRNSTKAFWKEEPECSAGVEWRRHIEKGRHLTDLFSTLILYETIDRDALCTEHNCVRGSVNPSARERL